MLRLVRTSLLVVGTAVCGPTLADTDLSERSERSERTTTSVATANRGAVVMCLLCWPTR